MRIYLSLKTGEDVIVTFIQNVSVEMVRLNNKVRDKIVKEALSKAFGDKTKKHKEKQLKFAQACRVYMFGGPAKFKKLKEVVEANPDLPVHIKEWAGVNIGGLFSYFDFPKDIHPKKDITIPGDHKLAAEFNKLISEKSKISEDRKSLSATLNGLLYSVNTTKQLLEVWPECKELLSESEVEPKKDNLPAIQMAEINKQIGIPSK